MIPPTAPTSSAIVEVDVSDRSVSESADRSMTEEEIFYEQVEKGTQPDYPLRRSLGMFRSVVHGEVMRLLGKIIELADRDANFAERVKPLLSEDRMELIQSLQMEVTLRLWNRGALSDTTSLVELVQLAEPEVKTAIFNALKKHA